MNFQRSGLITSLFALFIGGFWVSFINDVRMLTGYAWLLGARIGGGIYWVLASKTVDNVERLGSESRVFAAQIKLRVNLVQRYRVLPTYPDECTDLPCTTGWSGSFSVA